MKNEGKKFEEDIKKSFPAHWFSYRLRDSSGSWSNSGVSRFTPTNICDFFVFTGEKLIGIECKSFKGKSCPFNNIKENQVNGLYEINKFKNSHGVFFLNFRDLSETYILSAIKIKELILLESRKSISLEQARQFGILIPQIIKRTRYTYYFDNLID